MPTTKPPQPHWRVSALTILFPPLAHVRHRRYVDRPHHLAADTLLALLWIGLLVGNVWLWRHPEWLIPGHIESRMAVVGEVVSGGINEFTLSLNNSGPHPLTGIEFVIAPPLGWQPQDTSGATVTDQADRFLVGTLKSHETRIISFSGTFIGAPGEHQSITVAISGLDDDRQIESIATARWMVKRSGLILNIANPASVIQGQEFTVTAEVINTGTRTFDNSVIELNLPVAMKIISSAPPLVDNRWPVATLFTQDSRTFSFRAILLDSRQTKIDLTATASSVVDGREIKQLTVTKSFTVQPGSIIPDDTQVIQPNLVAEAHYYSDAGFQFGYGPLPPRVGQETVYRIFWYVQLPTGKYDATTITSSLPVGASWIGHPAVTHGAVIKYDATKRTILWKIGAVDGGQITMSGSFDVAIKPTNEDIGRILPLLNQTILIHDTAGKKEAPITVPVVTTRLNETAARGRDRVQP